MYRITCAAFLTICLTVVTPPTGSAGQVPAAAAVSDLKLGQQVRVAAPGIELDVGTVTELDGLTFVVAQEGQEWIIDGAALERLEVRRRSVTPSVLVFGLAGFLGGKLANKVLSESGEPDANKVPIGLALGTGLGFTIGMTQWRWRVVFPR